jgi:SAM-dependent methyltransferase
MDEIETKKAIWENYGKIAQAQGSCGCGSGSTQGQDSGQLARQIGYLDEELKAIPKEANLGLSCGNPTALAGLKKGETVLDLGSGAGFDVFLAAAKVGPEGKVIGVDMTPEMIEKARRSTVKNGIENVEFRLGEIENLPIEDTSTDIVISNCVINLAADKRRVFQEIYRVLKPGGRISISDIALQKELSSEIQRNKNAYVGCVAGAVLVEEYKKIVETSGLKKLKISTNWGEDNPMGIVSINVEAHK